MVNFVFNGITYNCCEQYMMSQKSLLFYDGDAYKKIMESNNPADHQKLGRTIKGFAEELWDDQKYNVVLQGNMARFTQSEPCKELLLSTGDRILTEASPFDCVWGVGLRDTDPLILDESNWRGQNLLGKVLMEVRDNIKKL
jgi:ribA/ribD-fused uncharacterized protein